MRKSIGSKTNPCGSPGVTVNGPKAWPCNTTCCVRLTRRFSIQFGTYSSKFTISESLFIRRAWDTWSNALVKSKAAAWTVLCVFVELSMTCIVTQTFASQENLFLYPCCLLLSFVSMFSSRFLSTKCSNILQRFINCQWNGSIVVDVVCDPWLVKRWDIDCS